MWEEWRHVPGHPLMASSFGRVKLLGYQPRTGSWVAKERRFIIRFKGKNYKVARLVCLAFHGLPPEGRPYCLHSDEDASNNRPDNLSWGTQKENLNAPGFVTYCKSRTGENSPRVKGMKF